MTAPTSHGSPQRTYARLWRWHFYAAILVIPFVLWQGTTGLIYLWSYDIADALWPSLRHVEVADGQVSLDLQRALAVAARDGAQPRLIKLSADPTRSTEFVFDAGAGLIMPVYVDPYRGALLGAVEATTWLPGLTRKLHGGWPLGDPGSWLLELGACWTLVMVLTGLYLWWPRSGRGLAGVLYPRLRRGPRLFWRDLHSVAGVWCSGVFIVFLLTALPWTAFWGDQILRPLQKLSGQTAPAALGFGQLAMTSVPSADGTQISLDQAVAIARAEGLDGDLEIQPRSGDAPIGITLRQGRSSAERVLQIDRYRGSVLGRVGWQDYPLIPKVVATGVDLHEGTFFGRSNQIVNSLVVAALYWLVLTGLIGWYRRRPNGGLAAPARQPTPIPRAIRWTALGACLLMPLLGLSVILIAAVDSLVLRLRRAALA